jgi:hypothetical protein
MDPLPEIFGWHLGQADMCAIEKILKGTIKDQAGPGFMAPPSRDKRASL